MNLFLDKEFLSLLNFSEFYLTIPWCSDEKDYFHGYTKISNDTNRYKSAVFHPLKWVIFCLQLLQ